MPITPTSIPEERPTLVPYLSLGTPSTPPLTSRADPRDRALTTASETPPTRLQECTAARPSTRVTLPPRPPTLLVPPPNAPLTRPSAEAPPTWTRSPRQLPLPPRAPPLPPPPTRPSPAPSRPRPTARRPSCPAPRPVRPGPALASSRAQRRVPVDPPRVQGRAPLRPLRALAPRRCRTACRQESSAWLFSPRFLPKREGLTGVIPVQRGLWV